MGYNFLRTSEAMDFPIIGIPQNFLWDSHPVCLRCAYVVNVLLAALENLCSLGTIQNS